MKKKTAASAALGMAAPARKSAARSAATAKAKQSGGVKMLAPLPVSVAGAAALRKVAFDTGRKQTDIQREALAAWFAKHARADAPGDFTPDFAPRGG